MTLSNYIFCLVMGHTDFGRSISDSASLKLVLLAAICLAELAVWTLVFAAGVLVGALL